MLTDTGYKRKLDSAGRLVIPTKLRNQMGMEEGEEYTFYILDDEETGKKYVCFECLGVTKEKLEEARRLVEKFGLH